MLWQVAQSLSDVQLNVTSTSPVVSPVIAESASFPEEAILGAQPIDIKTSSVAISKPVVSTRFFVIFIANVRSVLGSVLVTLPTGLKITLMMTGSIAI